VGSSRNDVSARAILGDEELAIAWLAENGVYPVKNRWGRYTLEEPPGQSTLTRGEKLLIVGRFGITSESELEAIQRKVKSHPRWKEKGEREREGSGGEEGKEEEGNGTKEGKGEGDSP